jgi:hypothetical protein
LRDKEERVRWVEGRKEGRREGGKEGRRSDKDVTKVMMISPTLLISRVSRLILPSLDQLKVDGPSS